MMGFKKSECITRVTFAANCYEPGQKIRLKIECDNTKCSHAVKSFKVKLQRKWVGFTDDLSY